MKQVVGKVLKIVDHEDENGIYHDCRWDYMADPIAYCKGKNGHYYLVRGWYSYSVMRIQRATQINADEIGSIDTENYNKPPEITPDKVYAKFGEIVAKHKPYRRKVRCKDMQRKRVYAWESECAFDALTNNKIKNRLLSRDEVQALVDKISAWAGIKSPEITYRNASFSYAFGSTRIRLATTAIDVVIHEMAHIVDSAMHNISDTFQGHGPSFVGCLITLNNIHMGFDIDMMKSNADKMNVKYDDFTVNKITENNMKSLRLTPERLAA